MSIQTNTIEKNTNPLDRIEDVLTGNNWAFNRMNNDELIVQVKGKYCDYRLFFIWQEDMNAIQFCCQYDITIADRNMKAASITLMNINENLWMGHFDLPQDTKIPSFRHTCLMRGVENITNTDHFEDLVDISMAQCERYFAVFSLLANTEIANDQNLSLALMDTIGES